MKEVSPLKAIRLKCLDCSCNSSEEVRECFAKKCPLYQYRFGYKLDENGNRRKKKLTEEHKEALKKRAIKARASKKQKSI